MCLIIYRKNLEIAPPQDILTQTAKENQDGFGITFLDTLQTVRTMDYDKAMAYLNEPRPYVAHFRYATRGTVGKKMCHPFHFKGGWLYSNGTVDGLGSTTVCDTQVVAELLSKTPKKHWKNILAMTPTRFVTIEKSGKVSLYGTWIEEGGILYSKDPSRPRPTVVTYSYGGRSNTTHTPYRTQADKNTEAYWENEVISKKLSTVKEGQDKLDAWLKERDPYGTTTEDVEEEVVATVMPDDDDCEGPEGFDEFCEELATYGFSYEHSFGEYSEDEVDGESVLVGSSTAIVITSRFYEEYPKRVYDFIVGDHDPFADAEDDWEDIHYVAVYGTLKRGGSNHSTLRVYPRTGEDRVEFIGTGVTEEHLRMGIRGGMPMVYAGNSESGTRIPVEVYEVSDPEVREAIDQLEGHPDNYTRRLTEVIMDDTENIITVWMYYVEGVTPQPPFVAGYLTTKAQ